MKKAICNAIKNAAIILIGLQIATTTRNYIENTFTNFPQAKLETIKETKLPQNTGLILIHDNTITYTSHQILLKNKKTLVQKLIESGKKEQIRFANEASLKTKNFNTLGSGACVTIQDTNYILTNHHITSGLSTNMEKKILSSPSLDISIIPTNLLSEYNTIPTCSTLSQTKLKKNEEIEFQGFGRNMYYSKSTPSSLYFYTQGLKINLNTTDLAFCFNEENTSLQNTYFANNFPGISGSAVYNSQKEITGTIKTVNSFSLHTFNPVLQLPMKKTFLSFTPASEINKFLQTKEAQTFLQEHKTTK